MSSASLLNTRKYTKINCILYPCNEHSENETKETIPYAIESKRIKLLWINLTK